jgi:hypothetical protein
MLGIFERLHAKMSMFTRRKSTSTVSYLGVKGGADAQRLSLWVGWIEGHELDVFHGLEVVGVLFLDSFLRVM